MEKLGKNYVDLKGAQKSNQAMLRLLLKAKSDLYTQAVEGNATIAKCECRQHTWHKNELVDPYCNQMLQGAYQECY